MSVDEYYGLLDEYFRNVKLKYVVDKKLKLF